MISLLESLAAAMPGLGFVIGGAVAAIFNPRTSYAVAGAGVLAVLAVASVALSRARWRGEPVEDLAATAGALLPGAAAARDARRGCPRDAGHGVALAP